MVVTLLFSRWGTNWTQVSNFSFWEGLAASADAKALVAVRDDGVADYPPGTSLISVSTDSGTTWTDTVFTNRDLVAAASSADGTKMFVAAYGGGIYTSQITPSPALNGARSGSQMLLSWIQPSTRFVLQENFDLAPNHWIDSSISPTLNLNTYRYEAIIPMLRPTDSTGSERQSRPALEMRQSAVAAVLCRRSPLSDIEGFDAGRGFDVAFITLFQ